MSTTPRAAATSKACPACGAPGSGFGDEEMIEAATEQLRTLPYYHLFGAKGTEPSIELAEKLKEIAPVPISKVFFTSSGSEANDTQVKFAWYMNNALGRPKKKKIISRIKAYHGVTIMSASLTGLPYNHIGWDLPVDRVLHTDCPHYYRFGKDGESEAEFLARMVQSLRDLIEREGPDTIAAFIAEPVMGAGGVIIPPDGYYRGDPGRARRARHHHDRRRGDHRLRPHRQLVGLPDGRHDADHHLGRQAADVGLCAARRRDGAGRHLPGLCRPFASRSARSAMASPMAAIRSAARSASRRSRSTRSATSSPMCASSRRSSQRGMKRIGEHPLVGETVSVGLIGAAELVADKKTKRSLRSQARGRRGNWQSSSRGHGAILRALGDRIAFCPPMIITEAELNELFDRFEMGLADTEAWVAKESLRAAV